jgi:hypothetical protein
MTSWFLVPRIGVLICACFILGGVELRLPKALDEKGLLLLPIKLASYLL